MSRAPDAAWCRGSGDGEVTSARGGFDFDGSLAFARDLWWFANSLAEARSSLNGQAVATLQEWLGPYANEFTVRHGVGDGQLEGAATGLRDETLGWGVSWAAAAKEVRARDWQQRIAGLEDDAPRPPPPDACHLPDPPGSLRPVRFRGDAMSIVSARPEALRAHIELAGGLQPALLETAHELLRRQPYLRAACAFGHPAGNGVRMATDGLLLVGLTTAMLMRAAAGQPSAAATARR
ncbi:hypothetical protein BH23ACT9_BH23ACT9_25480 [soil metagenome]